MRELSSWKISQLFSNWKMLLQNMIGFSLSVYPKTFYYRVFNLSLKFFRMWNHCFLIDFRVLIFFIFSNTPQWGTFLTHIGQRDGQRAGGLLISLSNSHWQLAIFLKLFLVITHLVGFRSNHGEAFAAEKRKSKRLNSNLKCHGLIVLHYKTLQ